MNFPIKVGNETDVENYAKTLIKGEEQLLITRNGKQFLTDGKGSYIPINTGSGTSGSGNASIDDINKSATTTYSSEKIETITGNIHDDTLDVNLKGKTLQEQIKTVFLSSNNIKKSLADVIGLPTIETDIVSKIASDIQNCKNDLALYLRGKGISDASSTQNLLSLVREVNNIIQHPLIKNTKLNVTTGTTKQVTLSNPIPLSSLCTSVLEYQAGTQGVVQYDCGFNNSDESNFVQNDSIVYDGTMHVKNKTSDIPFTETNTLDTYKEYTATIKQSNYYKINNIECVDVDDTTSKLIVSEILPPTIVYSQNDINLTNVEEISKVTWTTQSSEPNKLSLIVSVDGGKNYYSYYNGTWIIVDTSNLTDIETKGMNVTTVNSLTNFQWEELRKNSNLIRFAYYFNHTDLSKTANNDNITLTVNMIGASKIADGTKYKYELSSDGKVITYTFLDSNTYTIVYIDN